MVRKWSRKYDTDNFNVQKFSVTVSISLNDCTNAYQWKQTKAIIQFGDRQKKKRKEEELQAQTFDQDLQNFIDYI